MTVSQNTRDSSIVLRHIVYFCIDILKSNVFKHYTISMCAAREVNGWLSVSSVKLTSFKLCVSICVYYLYDIVLLYVGLCLSVCFYILSVFTAMWRINVFILLADLCNATFGYCHNMSSVVVCLSVTRVYCDKTAKVRIMQFSQKCSPMP